MTEQDFKLQKISEKIDKLADIITQYSNNLMNKELLNIEEACKVLSVSKRTLQSWRDSGIIPFSQIGSKIYFKTSDIRQIIEENRYKRFA